MPMRITKAIAIAGVVGALVSLSLAGCTSSNDSTNADGSACSGTASGSVSDSVKVSGTVGKEPTVSFSKGLSTKTTQKTTVDKGDGTLVEKGQPVLLQAALYDGTTGKKAVSTYSSSTGTAFTAGPSSSFRALTQGLVCAHVGDRFVVAGTPKDSTNGQGIADYGIGATDSVVFVVDVLKSFPSRASGTAVAPKAGLPTVKLAKDGAPTITMPKSGKAPSGLVAQNLITGSGAKVKEGDVLLMQYTGALYKGGKVFDSSWTRGQPSTFTLAQGQLIDGWVTGLVGKTVGSQVLLVIPPKDGYGSTAQSGIPANSTLVFVVDILGKVS